MPDNSLIQRNWDAFCKHQPLQYILLKKIGAPVSKAVMKNGRAVNIDLGAINLYPEDADVWTGEQVDQFVKDPDRILFSDPWHCNISSVSGKVLKKLTSYLVENKLEVGESCPVVDTGFGFVFGIGLGFHLPALIERKMSRQLYLIEPMPEFIIHSFSSLDWEKLFEDAEKNDIRLNFFLSDSPNEIIDSIGQAIISVGLTFLDGSYAYIHYYSWILSKARESLNASIKNFYISPGYFEDEIIMMSNTYGNLSQWPFHLVTRKPFLTQSLPVFIIGSGASLDNDLPYIKKWRDRVLVFSCGTGLGILLKNGIRPDLHVENENTPELANNLREFKNNYGFDGITLVVTTTVHNDVGDLFEKRWHYFRAALSSSVVLVGDAEPLLCADPLVSNAAFSVCVSVGFQNVYFFGVDCGCREGGDHHSQDSVYYEEGYDNFAEGESLEFIDNQLNREVPANFGGKALTSWCLDLSRVFITKLQKIRPVNLYNCSDGAKIYGAKPKVAAAIKLTNPPDMQQKTLIQIENQMSFYKKGEFLESLDFSSDVEGCDRFIKDFTKMIAIAKKEDKGFWEFENRFETYWQENYGELKAVLKIIGGSLYSILRLGAFMGNRIEDDKKRREFLKYFLDEFEGTCTWMAAEAKILLDEINTRQPTLSEVGVTDPKS